MEIERKEKVELLIQWLVEKKADDIISMDVSDRCSFTEHLIVCTGSATLHCKAIADHIIDQARSHKIRILGKEGFTAMTWILIDLNDVIIHIFTDENRKIYKIEDLWKTKMINEEAMTENHTSQEEVKI